MQPGQQIGPFTIEKQIGAGAMGAVYRGVYGKTGRKVAIKIMLPGAADNERSSQRFRREIDILKQLQHPHIVRLLHDGEHEGSHYYAMEYIQGETLEEVLARRVRYSWEEVVAIGQQLCDALQHAHEKGVIHRDLKPSNLMVLPDGTLKLTDFGIAKDLDVTALTEANCTVGTASYMSPEQCRGERNLTNRSDLYSLGIVLYELLTGRKPFTADNVMDMFMEHVKGTFERPAKFVPDLPKALDVLVCQMLEKKPDKRPRDAHTVGEALAHILEQIEARQSAGEATAKAGGAGKGDRAAARALLGEKKKRRPKKPEGDPQTRRKVIAAVLLLAGIVAIAAILWFTFKPAGSKPDKLYARIEKMMEDPKKWKDAQGPIMEYLRTFGSKEDERTQQVRRWKDQVGMFLVEQELTEAVAAAKKIDVEKMDALPEVGRDSVRAAIAENEGDLDSAEKKWRAVIRNYPDAPGYWVRMANKRVNEQLPAVRATFARLGKEEMDRFRELRGEKMTFAGGEAEQRAFDAARLEEIKDLFEARRRWLRLREDAETSPDQRTWFLLAAWRARELKNLPATEDETTWRRKKVDDYLDAAKRLREESRILESEARYRHVVELYSREMEFAAQVERAKKEGGI